MERYYFYCDFDFDFDIYALLETIKSFQKYDFDTTILFDNLKKQKMKKFFAIIKVKIKLKFVQKEMKNLNL